MLPPTGFGKPATVLQPATSLGAGATGRDRGPAVQSCRPTVGYLRDSHPADATAIGVTTGQRTRTHQPATVCKTVSSAYIRSNPTPATLYEAALYLPLLGPGLLSRPGQA